MADDATSTRLRSAQASARAAERHQKAARENHLQRLAEREACHKIEDAIRHHLKLHGPRHDLDQRLHEAEFKLKTVSARAEATAAVAAKADMAAQETIRAFNAARQSTFAEDQLRHEETTRKLMHERRQRFEAQQRQQQQPATEAHERRQRLEAQQRQQQQQATEAHERRQRFEAQQRQQQQQATDAREQQERRNEERRREAHARQKEENARKREEERSTKQRMYEQQSESRRNRFSHVLKGPQLAQTLWKKNVERAFSDYASMKVFPEPPKTGKCFKPACVAGASQRMLRACACDVESAFTALRLPLKEARLAWHPDRFSKCSADNRAIFQMKAKEVFQVVMKMYSEAGETV